MHTLNTGSLKKITSGQLRVTPFFFQTERQQQPGYRGHMKSSHASLANATNELCGLQDLHLTDDLYGDSGSNTRNPKVHWKFLDSNRTLGILTCSVSLEWNLHFLEQGCKL